MVCRAGAPGRLTIVRALAAGEKTAAELASLLDLRDTTVNSAVGVLERAGVIYTHVDGRNRHCRLVSAKVKKGAVELTSPGRGEGRAAAADGVAHEPFTRR